MITHLSFDCELELPDGTVECCIEYTLDSEELIYCWSVVPVPVDVRSGDKSIADQIFGVPDREQIVEAACMRHFKEWRLI